MEKFKYNNKPVNNNFFKHNAQDLIDSIITEYPEHDIDSHVENNHTSRQWQQFGTYEVYIELSNSIKQELISPDKIHEAQTIIDSV